jgi:hypothetical protein
MASWQVYSPKNYADANYKQLFLFHKLGGRAVAELAHRTQGLPSIDATRHHICAQPLHASPKMPTASEMSANLDISYPPSSALPTTHCTCCIGFQLMADEIKIESRLRWDSRTNMILGVCREAQSKSLYGILHDFPARCHYTRYQQKRVLFHFGGNVIMPYTHKAGADCYDTRPQYWHSATPLMFLGRTQRIHS